MVALLLFNSTLHYEYCTASREPTWVLVECLWSSEKCKIAATQALVRFSCCMRLQVICATKDSYNNIGFYSK